MPEITPPFYSNTPDGVHCLQASLKMVLDATSPELKITLPELLYISGNSGEEATWPIRSAVYLARAGFDVVFMDPFPLPDFIKDPKKALSDFYGEEAAEWQIENSDIKRATLDAKYLLETPHIDAHFENVTFDDLASLLEQGYLCICNVNSKALKGEEGYSGHFVVVYKIDSAKRTVWVQNPGPPSSREAEVSFDVFDKAWAHTGPKYRNILAVKGSDRLKSGLNWLREELQKYKHFVYEAITSAS